VELLVVINIERGLDLQEVRQGGTLVITGLAISPQSYPGPHVHVALVLLRVGLARQQQLEGV